MDERTASRAQDDIIGDRPLRLARMEIFPVCIPLKRPMKMSGSIVSSAENVFIRIEDENGVVGWGEAASAPMMTGETLQSIAAASNIIWERLKHCDLRFRAQVLRRIQTAIYGNASAKSAIEMALFDLIGNHYQMNVSELIGGRYRDQLEPMWLLGNSTVDEDVHEARTQSALGFRFFKLKVGTKKLSDDVNSIMGARDAIGPDKKLCLDANGALTYDAAVVLIKDGHSANVLYFEQPLSEYSISGMEKLNTLNIIPIGADESIHSRRDIEECARRNAISGLSLKLIKLGGLSESLASADRAIELGLSINIAAKVAETSLASSAAAHLGAGIRAFEWGISLTQIYLECDPVKNPLIVEDGLVSVPQGHGFGVKVDEQALKDYSSPDF